MAEGKARRVDFYPDEYIAGVGGTLRADEQGVYWMLCSLIMSEGHGIEQNDRRISALCGIRPAAARRIVDKLVTAGKIQRQSDGKLLQKRSQSEVEKSLKRIQTASENGSNGGRPKQKHQVNQQILKAGGSFDEKLTTNYQPPTTNHKEKETPNGVPKKRASRLPADWSPPSEWIDEAMAKGLSRKAAIESADRMKNWSLSAEKGAKLDWHATWRNWFVREMPKAKSTATTKAQLFGRM
jgi:hypothetical protein